MTYSGVCGSETKAICFCYENLMLMLHVLHFGIADFDFKQNTFANPAHLSLTGLIKFESIIKAILRYQSSRFVFMASCIP